MAHEQTAYKIPIDLGTEDRIPRRFSGRDGGRAEEMERISKSLFANHPHPSSRTRKRENHGSHSKNPIGGNWWLNHINWASGFVWLSVMLLFLMYGYDIASCLMTHECLQEGAKFEINKLQ